MLVIHDPALTVQILDAEMATIAACRFAMLSEDEPYDPKVHGFLVVLEAGDSVDVLDAQLGFPVLANRFDGVRFGEQGFHPSFEFIEEHKGCYEMVFVLSDDGYGVEVFIPKVGNIDHGLLAMCRQYAVRSPEVSIP